MLDHFQCRIRCPDCRAGGEAVMSQIVDAEAFKADAEEAADKGLKPEQCLHKYEPNLHCIWRTHYFRRVGEIEREERLSREAA